ncbi:regulator of RNase E activity RraA [Angulomicrobium tetraedrale]|uniref:Putative 4-hydroxy-4-methyl-2-oxoglutarate aldolase n=1 Tax=Ancylobacter tetraedralis TaxID=217068 RepID=A0A839Z2Y7_9HYPH|nr:RraA family protein [Ancylobacter tetraedralis]MBB3770022.1 regulator of RNase E activity RraA [Ancylobacter tetraedralis]
MSTDIILEQLRPYADRLVGNLDPRLIRQVEIERFDPAIIAGYLALPDLTSMVADILDEFGYDTAVPSLTLRPLATGQRIVGPAVTARQSRARRLAGHALVNGEKPRGGGIDQITLTRAGDVFVVDGGGGIDASSFGGLLATASHAKGLAGIVVDGSVRDKASIVRSGLAVWSRSVTPRTGKHRLELVEFNGTVTIAGVQIRPGDLVLGDDDGLIIVPPEIAGAVLEKAQVAASRESVLVAALAEGRSPQEAAKILPPSKW